MIATRKRTAAFALLAAIGVVALLGLLIVGVANNAQVTYAFARARTNDTLLTDLTTQMASRLASRDDLTTGTTPGRLLLEVRTSGPNTLVGRATIAASDPRGLVGSVIRPQEGDVLVKIEAAAANQRGLKRLAVYLVNSTGKRGTPILLSESRQ